MNFLDDINDKTIIVCSNNVKEKVLDNINRFDRLINVKIYSLSEIKRNVLFDYDDNAILYLMNKYNYSYEIARNYIENIYFIEDKNYSSNKLMYLVELKKELETNKLIKFNKYFYNAYKDNQFIIVGYDYLTSFDKKLLSNFNYRIIKLDEINKETNVYEFNTMEEELTFIINRIIDLIKKGIDINKIRLVNLDSDYEKEVIKLFKLFNVPVDISTSSNLLSTILGKKAYEFLKENKSFQETLDYIESYGLDNSNNQIIYNKFLNIFNKYIEYDYDIELIIKLIKKDLENTILNNNILKNKVRVESISNNIFLDDEYVFFVGFNQGSVPRVFKDEDYINDDLKVELGLDSVNVINKYERIAIIDKIKSIKNLTITYKRNYLDNEYYPSNLLSDSMFNIIKDEKITTNYSLLYSKIKLSSMLDNLIKYDMIDDELDKYFNSFNIRFMEYDNSFKGLDNKLLYKYLSNSLTLSYSTIDTFYKCQFRYYLDNILKLNKYEETFNTIIGSLFHYVLSHVYDKDFDLEKYYQYFLKDKEFSNKELFYLDILKKELKIICDRLLEFQNDTGLTSVFTEKNLKVEKNSDIEVIFKGIVDKIMYKKYDNETVVAIIDYKTGHTDIDISNSIYGIGMQLIVYLYLITKSDLFDKFSCAGFYLQQILNNEVNIDKNKSYLEIKNDNLKLYGYSTNDTLRLARFDPTYENSSYIRGMKTTKTGFSAYSKVIDDNEMTSLVELVDKKIDNARDLILKADFSINPKKLSNDKEITGCQYCKYRDRCNRKNEDIVYLEKYKDISFLNEGDNNA